jgi:hypothetical protein
MMRVAALGASVGFDARLSQSASAMGEKKILAGGVRGGELRSIRPDWTGREGGALPGGRVERLEFAWVGRRWRGRRKKTKDRD